MIPIPEPLPEAFSLRGSRIIRRPDGSVRVSEIERTPSAILGFDLPARAGTRSDAWRRCERQLGRRSRRYNQVIGRLSAGEEAPQRHDQ
jgi:hypothetical protein